MPISVREAMSITDSGTKSPPSETSKKFWSGVIAMSSPGFEIAIGVGSTAGAAGFERFTAHI